MNAGDHFYNFDSEENAAKWKGVLIAALRRVSVRVIECGGQKNNEGGLLLFFCFGGVVVINGGEMLRVFGCY